MKKLLFAIVLLSPAGCGPVPHDLLLTDEVAQAQQETRLAGMEHLSCSELHTHHTANLMARTPLGFFAPVAGPLGDRNLSDAEEMMRRKGCRLPEGVES